MNAPRAMGPELILIMNAGLRKCPETFFRTLGAEDVTRFHPEISPTDTLGARNSRARAREAGAWQG